MKPAYVTTECKVCGMKGGTLGQLLRCAEDHQRQWGAELKLQIVKQGRTATLTAEARR